MSAPNRDHVAFLSEALRAPSAHNAQPWRLVPHCNGTTYEVHYDHSEYLPHDPDDRDAYLTMGAFCESLALAAPRHGYVCTFSPRFERTGSDLFVGVVDVAPQAPGDEPDPLAALAAGRTTNRQPYLRAPLPPALVDALGELGCVFVEPRVIAPVVRDASVLSWIDRQFVKDLKRWTRFHEDADDGMTPGPLALSRLDTRALQFALWRGQLSRPLARVYARRDVQLTHASSTVAVLAADSLEPDALFEAGRRLLRAWTTVNAAGYSYHPLSVVIDRPETAPRLAAIAGVPCPVALFRVGYTDHGVPASNRRSLDKVLVSSS